MGLNGGPYSVGRGDVGWEKEMEGEGMKGEWWQRKDGIRSFRVGFFASLQPMPLTSSSDTFSIMSKSLISTNPILCPSGGCGTPTAIMKGALYSSIRGKGSDAKNNHVSDGVPQPALVGWSVSSNSDRSDFAAIRGQVELAQLVNNHYVSVDFQRNNYGMKSPTKKKIPPNNAAKQKKHVAQHYVSAHELLPRFLMTQVFPRGDAKNFYQKTVWNLGPSHLQL